MRTLDSMNNFSSDVFEGFDVTEDEVTHFRNNHVGFCGVDMNRLSQFLLIQLTSISKHGTHDSFLITDVIQELEGVGRGCKQRVDQFKHMPLKGLFKAHFSGAQFLVRNLVNHWGLEFENSPKFNSLCSYVIEEEQKNPSKFGWQGRLAHEMVISGYKERARQNKLTGEWIIFAKHKNLNYYLCISRHSKSNRGDQEIYDFLKLLCEHEYPFLLSDSAI
ncbi:MAG: hypothetical protein CMH21_06450 [Methylophaga sp.]|nr:hypothetical protein [Methylophaga sp.]MAY17361.1 hypothetical protein [Methylophaga sp.]